MSNEVLDTEALIGDKVKLEVKVDITGSGTKSWCHVPGANSITLANGERAINTITTFEGTRNRIGPLNKPTMTVEMTSWLPHLPVIRAIVAAHKDDDNNRLEWRWTFPALNILTDISVATAPTAIIGTDGVLDVTVRDSGGNDVFDEETREVWGSDQVPYGCSLFGALSGNNVKDYIVIDKTFNSSDELQSMKFVDASTFAYPSSSVSLSAKTIGFRTPAVQTGPIVCEVTKAGDQNATTSQAGVGSEIMLSAIALLPDPKVISN